MALFADTHAWLYIVSGSGEEPRFLSTATYSCKPWLRQASSAEDVWWSDGKMENADQLEEDKGADSQMRRWHKWHSSERGQGIVCRRLIWWRDWKQNRGCIEGNWSNEVRSSGENRTEQWDKVEGIYSMQWWCLCYCKGVKPGLYSTEMTGEQVTGDGDEVLEESGGTDEAW